MIKRIYFLLLFLAFVPAANASHFMGAVLWYDCLSPCTYRVYHNSYYDCSGAATVIPVLNLPTSAPPPPSNLTINGLGSAGCLIPLQIAPWTFVSYLEVSPICPQLPGQSSLTACDGNSTPILSGVAEAVFYADYDFCSVSCDTIIFEWSSCCRNYAITSGAAGDGILVSTMIDLTAASCNGSPVFNQPPHAYLCSSLPTFVDVSANDPDGDSLVYSLTSCMSNSTTPVGYNFGYSPTSFLGNNWNVSLDNQTGLLSVAPVLSNGPQVVGVVCVLVEEYRNGVKIGEILQDIQVSIIDCSIFPNQNPILDTVTSISGVSVAAAAGDTIVVCPGTALQVDFSFIDPDVGDLVSLSLQAPNLSGYTFTPASGNPATGILNWTPTAADVGQTFSFFLIATDDHCPKPGQFGHLFYAYVDQQCLDADITAGSCGSFNGAIDLHVWGGLAPYTYLWSNGASTQDISNLAPGTYSVSVTDANGINSTASFLVTASDLLLTLSETQPSCYASDGSLAVSVSGNGVPPYTFQWNTGATTDSIGGLTPGGYSVVVTDSSGCLNQWVGILEPQDSCYVFVSGTLFDDLNGNCVLDPGEPGIPNQLIDLTPGPAILTDTNGYYSLQLDTGFVSLEALLGNYMSPSCVNSDSTSLYLTTYGNVINDIDFATSVLTVQDLVLQLTTAPAIPGFQHVQFATVINAGAVTVNSATLQLQYDPQAGYVQSLPAATTVNTSNASLEWQFGPIAPGAQMLFALVTQIDSTQTLGSSLGLSGQVLPLVGDTTPVNNVDSVVATVVASYDPNDKQVSPIGIGPLGFIQASRNLMKYTVRFQNTGNYPAQYVVIRDTIDQDLDPKGIQSIAASHAFSLMVEDDSVLVFTFAHINLPDSTRDPVGSQGFVTYLLPHKETLSIGTEITNSAAIYFDFNAPVITNSVRNTIFVYPEVAIEADTLCEGELVHAQLSTESMPPYYYIWNTGEQGFSNDPDFTTAATISGYYTLTITDSFGFGATDSVKMWVDMFPDAAFGFSRQGTQVDFSDASQAGELYFWDFGDGNTANVPNPQHIYAGSGEYQVQLIVGNKCGTDTLVQNVSIYATDLEDEFIRSVSVVPNPFSNKAHISFANPLGQTFRLRLYDLNGKLVQQYAPSQEDLFMVERKGLSPGMYLFRLEGEQHYTGKLIIE